MNHIKYENLSTKISLLNALYFFTLGLDKETCLISMPSGLEPPFAEAYNLVTENLVLTQFALRLGFHRYWENA